MCTGIRRKHKALLYYQLICAVTETIRHGPTDHVYYGTQVWTIPGFAGHSEETARKVSVRDQ